MNEQVLEQVIKEVLKNISTPSNGGSNSSTSTSFYKGSDLTSKDYPIGEKRPELIKTPSGKQLNTIVLDDLLKGNVKSDDFRITAETLEMQASVADSVGRTPFAHNLRRAGELTRVPDEKILEMYNALRPGRSTKQELLTIGDELDRQYSAPITATFVREAADVYEKRNYLKK